MDQETLAKKVNILSIILVKYPSASTGCAVVIKNIISHIFKKHLHAAKVYY